MIGLRRALLMFVALGAAACGARSTVRFVPCDVRDRSCQESVFVALEELRGQVWDPALVTPEVSVVTPERYRSQVLGMNTGLGGADNWSGSLQRLGLLPAGVDASDADLEWRLENEAARYMPTSGRVLLMYGGGEIDTEYSVSLLAHEFVHAAQDREFQLGYFGSGTTDGELVRTSFIEGEATLYDTLALLQMSDVDPRSIDWRNHFGQQIAAVRRRVEPSAAAHAEIRLSLPYSLGGAFLSAAWMDGGPLGINRAFVQSPRASVQLMLASEGLPFEIPPGKELCRPRLERTGLALSGVDTLGAAMFYVFLSRTLGLEPEAWQSALTWRNDRLWLFRDPTGKSSTVWRVHAPGLATSPLGPLLSARTLPPVLIGEDLLHWSSEDPAIEATFPASLGCD